MFAKRSIQIDLVKKNQAATAPSLADQLQAAHSRRSLINDVSNAVDRHGRKLVIAIGTLYATKVILDTTSEIAVNRLSK